MKSSTRLIAARETLEICDTCVADAMTGSVNLAAKTKKADNAVQTATAVDSKTKDKEKN